MRIYFNREPVAGPWGGGSKILAAIIDACREAGHEISVIPSSDPYPDVMFCMDPRLNASGVSFENMLSTGIPIVQRVGDLGTHGKPELTSLLLQTMPKAKTVIFPSDWAKNMIGNGLSNCVVIPNAPVKNFYFNRNMEMTTHKPIRIVTHHWSTNDKKGFDFYSKFQNAINPLKMQFTFIGRTNGAIASSGVMDINELSVELPKHDIYLTASKEEAGANHVLEAMAAGLPVVYHADGGSIPEYCFSGLPYMTVDEAIASVTKIAENYSFYKMMTLGYSDQLVSAARKYVEIIERSVL